MTKIFSAYQVIKKNKAFTLPSGELLPQTATVSFQKENGKTLLTLELGVVDASYLYERIEGGHAVNLDQCYIENFSLAAYRQEKNISPHQYISIDSFRVTNSVFYSEKGIDFTYARFSSAAIDFSHSIFLEGGINFDHSDFGNGDINFDNVRIHGGGAVFSNASFGKGLLSFKNSTFNNEARDLRTEQRKRGRRRSGNILNFEAATFEEGTIDFTRSTLGSGYIRFSNASLNKRDLLFVSAEFNTVRVAFKSVEFSHGKLDFRFANFQHGDLVFDRAVFNKGMVDFSATEFKGGKISFNRTEFEKNELIFESSEFEKGRITFKNNVFGAGTINFNTVDYRSCDISFEHVDFGNFTASFLKARINTLTFKSCHLNAYFNLQLQQCHALEFSNTVVRDIVDVKPFGFKPSIDSLDLSGLLLLGQLYIDWNANKVKDLILNQQTTHRNRSEQFRILKENYHALGQYDAEDEAYVEFRRSEAKADLEEALTDGSFLRKVNAAIVYGFKWLVFDKIGLYATSPVRVLVSMGVTYLFFVGLFYFLPFFVENGIMPSVDHADNLSELETAFYHSIITFLTIGYGDYYPSGIFRWISGFEGFMGLFLISYFTVAFVRKVLR